MSTTSHGIVVGYDGSAGGDRALRWAIGEAQARNCELRVCLAWAPQFPTMPDEASVLDQAGQRGEEVLAVGFRYAEWVLGAGRTVRLLARGAPASVLCEQSAVAEMVVLGSRGHGGVAGLALGSVPYEVAGHAVSPVVVVRGPSRRPNHAPGPVVAGVDGSVASEHAISFAFREAELRHAPLLAVCALADAPASIGVARQVEADFAHAVSVREKEYPDVTVVRKVSAGSPRRSLLDAAAGARLLVVGSRGRGGLPGMCLGSVAQAVLRHAPCPVVVVPTPAAVAWGYKPESGGTDG